jgi:hypothetical protein
VNSSKGERERKGLELTSSFLTQCAAGSVLIIEIGRIVKSTSISIMVFLYYLCIPKNAKPKQRNPNK